MKHKLQFYLDYIPLVILTIYSVVLFYRITTSDTSLLLKHYFGFVALGITYLIFFWRHKLGVFVLGLIILLGLLSILSFDYQITTTTYFITIFSVEIPLFYGQPIYILWLFIHLVLSYRYYMNIWTKEYWQELLKELKQAST